MIPVFTHYELVRLWDAVSAYVENCECNDEVDAPKAPPAAVSALEKLDLYMAGSEVAPAAITPAMLAELDEIDARAASTMPPPAEPLTAVVMAATRGLPETESYPPSGRDAVDDRETVRAPAR